MEAVCSKIQERKYPYEQEDFSSSGPSRGPDSGVRGLSE
jgi:hypothetical protein